MLQFFKNILSESCSNDLDHSYSDNDKLKIATCALFLEIAHSDNEISKVEITRIYELMKNTFQLTDEEVANLIELSQEQVKKSVSLYEFTEIINEQFNVDQKYMVLKNLWRIVLADNILDPYEEHLVKKISGNLKFYHKEMIAAKLEVKKEIDSTSENQF